MKNLSNIGRIFYGIAVAVLGFLTLYYGDFPYMLIPPKHSWIPGLSVIAFLSGAMLMVAGVCIIFQKKIFMASVLLGSVLLLIFCFYFIPYELLSGNYMHFRAWENAAKELTLAGGAFVIANLFLEKNTSLPIGFLKKLIPLGCVFFSVAIISYGINHFLVPEGVASYTPSWVSYRLFWAYFTGTALLGSGIAIIFKIKVGLIASLLGGMIFTWFIILHIPRVVASPVAYLGSEITSACLALAYSGIAFVIAGTSKR
jgi:hypothetical protein